MGTGNNYSQVIRLFVKPIQRIPMGYAVSGDGKSIANGSNGYSGIAPSNLEIDLQSYVWRGYESGKVYCGENLSKNTIITYNNLGMAIPHYGNREKIGRMIADGKQFELSLAYFFPVSSEDLSTVKTFNIVASGSDVIALLNINDYSAGKWILKVFDPTASEYQVKELLVTISSSGVKKIEYAVLGDLISYDLDIVLIGDYINIFFINNTVDDLNVSISNIISL